MRIGAPKNFWSGVMFVAIGLFAALWARTHYRIGTSLTMGPGYLPMVLGGLLAAIGAVLIIASFRDEGVPATPVRWRSTILVPGAAILYGYLLVPLGVVLSTMLLAVVASLGGREFRPVESLMLGAALAAMAVVVFVMGLGMPLPIWPRLF